MIPQRIECPDCGTKFTPDSDNDVTCGECALWHRPTVPWDIHEAPYRLRDRAKYEHDELRSLENYRRAAGLKPSS